MRQLLITMFVCLSSFSVSAKMCRFRVVQCPTEAPEKSVCFQQSCEGESKPSLQIVPADTANKLPLASQPVQQFCRVKVENSQVVENSEEAYQSCLLRLNNMKRMQ